jgi:DNA invertase Pin-like site-specific DNA recombinase/AraC-like DNA-binding protein
MSGQSIRCAIYTRKSSEEGLEQSFNSLEAQHEACRAFILSQKHEGWNALNDRYDDGGFSGGSMERPGLEKLLRDVKDHKVDAVVVYKVDRLTRSLLDFAKIIEILDSAGVSFVSVTQQFNTTSSMGRLTLNVLLSFAQFEREITGERIRDKIAASKKKGMWMGGVVPLGYDCVDHRLIINSAEAGKVRMIFRQYLRLGCVQKLKRYLDGRDIRSKVRTNTAGKIYGGASFSRGALYQLLSNRTYTGKITHRQLAYPGQHPAIVPSKLWDQVAVRLTTNNRARRTATSQSTASLLSGILFDSSGIRFTPTHSLKGGKRYRYYTSQSVIRGSENKPQIGRFPAEDLEHFVRLQIHRLLQAPAKCTVGLVHEPESELIQERARVLASQWMKLEVTKQDEALRRILKRVVVSPTAVAIEIEKSHLFTHLLGRTPEAQPASTPTLKLTGKFQVQRRAGELQIIAPDQSPNATTASVPVAKAVIQARDWYERILSGEACTIKELAKQSGFSSSYVKRLFRCASLSPKVSHALLRGKHRNLTLKALLRRVPLDWREQEKTILQTRSVSSE